MTSTDTTAELCSATANQLEKLLFKMYELEATLSNSQGGTDVLHTRMLEYLQEMTEAKQIASALPQDVRVPVELLRDVDEGGHPDIFTANTFKACLADNQAAKGKVTAFRQFSSALLQHAAEAFPSETAAYRAVAGTGPTTEIHEVASNMAVDLQQQQAINQAGT